MKFNKLFMIILILMLLPLIACSKEEEEEGHTGEIGEEIFHDSVLGDQEITLLSVSEATEYEGEKPELDVFIIVEVSFENVSEEPILQINQPSKMALNSTDYAFHGNEYTSEYSNPGDTVTDTVIFDVKKSEEYRLDYNFGMLKRLNITWFFDDEDFVETSTD